MCSASRPDANKAATTLKQALGGGAEWAVLCCTMRLLKLVIKVQADASQPKEGGGGDTVLQDRAKATFGGKVPTVSQRRSAIRSQLASCFADVWFPPINLEVSGSQQPSQFTADNTCVVDMFSPVSCCFVPCWRCTCCHLRFCRLLKSCSQRAPCRVHVFQKESSEYGVLACRIWMRTQPQMTMHGCYSKQRMRLQSRPSFCRCSSCRHLFASTLAV